jgi:hypothetical protein
MIIAGVVLAFDTGVVKGGSVFGSPPASEA